MDGEEEYPIRSHTREEMRAPETAVTKFRIEIHDDTAALLERIVEEISDLVTSLFEAIAEICQSLHSLESEDRTALTKISIGILIVNWVACNAISPFVEMYFERIRETDLESSVPATVNFGVLGILNFAFADFGLFANHVGDKTLRVEASNDAESGMNSIPLSFTDIIVAGSNLLDFIPPAAMKIVGPLTVITLTCVIADNKYYLFATVFAPMVDHVLSSIKSFVDTNLSSSGGFQHRTIPDDGESRDGVLWGMIVLFCLESLLVGSIIVLMVLISLLLTIFASIPTILSPGENPELIQETTKILLCFLFLWVGCVVSINVLRMVLYQTIESDD